MAAVKPYRASPISQIGSDKLFFAKELKRIENSSEQVANVLANQQVAFSVHKGGTAQTGLVSATYTLITFGTKEFDEGNRFASDAWVPPAGLIRLEGRVHFTGTTTAGTGYAIAAIFKNGVLIAQVALPMGTNFGTAHVSCITRANGTDSYSLYGYASASAGTLTVAGDSGNTAFSGAWLAP